MTKRSEDGSRFGRSLSVSGGLGGFGWENTPADYLMATTNRSRWAFADFEGRVGRNDADVAAFSLGSVQVDEKRKFVIRYR